MSNLYTKISVKEKTKEKFKRCFPEFINHHPEFKDFKITEDFMMQKICDFYLEH